LERSDAVSVCSVLCVFELFPPHCLGMVRGGGVGVGRSESERPSLPPSTETTMHNHHHYHHRKIAPPRTGVSASAGTSTIWPLSVLTFICMACVCPRVCVRVSTCPVAGEHSAPRLLVPHCTPAAERQCCAQERRTHGVRGSQSGSNRSIDRIDPVHTHNPQSSSSHNNNPRTPQTTEALQRAKASSSSRSRLQATRPKPPTFLGPCLWNLPLGGPAPPTVDSQDQ
jgi:hypothetical protein